MSAFIKSIRNFIRYRQAPSIQNEAATRNAIPGGGQKAANTPLPAYFSVTAILERRTLHLPEEATIDFDAHNTPWEAMTGEIGRTVLRAIDGCRRLGMAPVELAKVRFVVKFHPRVDPLPRFDVES